MSDYIKKIKSLVYFLFAVSQPISPQDLIDHALNGLGPTYDPFEISVYPKLDDLSVANVDSMFLNYEQRLECSGDINACRISIDCRKRKLSSI